MTLSISEILQHEGIIFMTWAIVSVWNRAETAWNYARYVDTIPACPGTGHLTNSHGHLLDEIQTNNLFNDLIPSQERHINVVFLSICRNEDLLRSGLRLSHILITQVRGLGLHSLAGSPCQRGADVPMSTSNIITGPGLCCLSPRQPN